MPIYKKTESSFQTPKLSMLSVNNLEKIPALERLNQAATYLKHNSKTVDQIPEFNPTLSCILRLE